MVSSRGVLAALGAFAYGCQAVTLHANASASTFMLVAGATSAEELCLSEIAGSVRLDACSKAVAAADGNS